jgi:uncharacterized protein with HEPN domain
MPRDATELLIDILRSANDVMDYVAGLDFDAFVRLPYDDRKTYRAIKNAIAEMGQAIKSLPQEIKDRNASIDWPGLAGLRDIVAHQYHRIEMEMLWPVIKDEFPALVQVAEAELRCYILKPK